MFDDVTFPMTSFSVKKWKKLDLLGEEKNQKPKIVSKVP